MELVQFLRPLINFENSFNITDMVQLLRPLIKFEHSFNVSLHKSCLQFIKQTTNLNMSDPTQQVSLPQSVEHLINKICAEQNIPPPDPGARHGLSLLGEDGALEVLRTISSQKIKYTFTGFINCLVKSRNNNNNVSPLKRVCLSPSPQQNRSPKNLMIFSQGADDGMNQSPVPEQLRGSALNSSSHAVQLRGSTLSSSSHAVSYRATTPQYVALGELEFRKSFLILSYIGEKSLEEVITADKIRGLKDLQMARFELEVWNALGRNYIKQEDRRKSVDWDSGKTHFYYCHVSTNGSCTFKGPYLNQTKTHLQRELGDDNILLVKFAEEVGPHRSFTTNGNDSYSKYNEIAREGILVGLRRYRFFVFKDGGKEEKKKDPTTSPVKCYFVRMESDASIDKGYHYITSGKTVNEVRAMFMHVHTVSSVANYMSRLSLVLSKTMKLEVDLSSINIQRIDDEPCRDKDGNVIFKNEKALIHTDGTGFISEDLALRCPTYVYKGKCTNDNNVERSIEKLEFAAKFSDVARPESHCGEPPLLMQVRLFYKGIAVKGTLLVNKKLPPRTIQIRRPSMIKVEADPTMSDNQTFNSLEVVKTSNQPRKTYLSKNLIALLSYGGVPEIFFVDILRKALEDAQGVFSNKRSALKVSLNYGGMDDFKAARMILAGVSLDEPYLRYRLSILMKEEKKSLQAGRLPVTESYYLMGTVDPTGILKSNEVCIILNDGQVSWEKVLVYRNPGLHFGDVHVLKATYVKELLDFVGTSKYAIFFPCNGPRSLADEIAGGDFDGDMYFVSRNPELLKHFKESERWTSTSTDLLPNKRPSDFSPEELEDELFKLFLNTRFQPSYAKSLAADYWQAIMDRFLTLGDESAGEKAVMKENMLRLINIYYDALDAPKKSGKKIEVPRDLMVDKFPHYMGRDESVSFESTSVLGKIYNTVKSFEAVDLSVKEIWKLPCFDGGAPEASMTKWKDYYDQYRSEMQVAMQNVGEDKEEAAEQVINKYKRILYGATEFEQSTRNLEEIYNEALAIYNVTYDFARSRGAVSYCSFAWKVAGSALCKLYIVKQGEKSMLCSSSVLKEVCG